MSTDNVAIRQSTFSIGKLVSFDWRIGIALSSNIANNINYPYVSLLIRVSEAEGQISSHSLELSLAEFQEFSKNMRNMADVIESLS